MSVHLSLCPSVNHVLGKTWFSRPLIEISLLYFFVQIPLINEHLFCKYCVRLSVGNAKKGFATYGCCHPCFFLSFFHIDTGTWWLYAETHERDHQCQHSPYHHVKSKHQTHGVRKGNLAGTTLKIANAAGQAPHPVILILLKILLKIRGGSLFFSCF